ncbi:MAG: 16S rRNA (guanine(527)-N(7))-methyltransferase RsmG [Alphaproteobacteria bacterium]|nr:16S rRNA (guanine(527)-N(7))-methyltransferase RsmG [Alphaproteobacteria bacterium]
MDINFELQKYAVSRETIQKLNNFVEILRNWNNKMNLVSKNSMNDVWERHVLDSLQLLDYIPQNAKQLVDIGSGAGFPAAVLAIVMQEKMPQTKITMVESIVKKTVYLNDVSQKLGLFNVKIENNRVENIVFKDVDVVTARAVAALDVLCGYAYKIIGKSGKLLFLKGRTYEQEHTVACQKWDYDLTIYPNKYCGDGVLMELCNLRKKQ